MITEIGGKEMKQIAVIGAGKFGISIAQTLTHKGYQVLLIDKDMEKIQEMSDLVTKAIQLDATDEKALRALGLKDFDVVIVAIGRQSMEDSIIITMMLKEMGVSTVVAKALNEAHGRILMRVGADKVVFPERDMGIRVANMLISPSIIDQLGAVPGYSIAEVEAPKALIGRTIGETGIKSKYGVQIVMIKRMKSVSDEDVEDVLEEDVIVAPSADTIIKKGDILLIIGKDEDIHRFQKM